ncbi:hypothetical protein Xkoz_01845 [Xenorhabdus kozodoii]|uniref:Uncharacterized protein n=1 Tax=Xenorhabdus kozodoii TaxID=351676 RepID=A0A2D0LCM8_9GAMM|nr:hypothetical protein Xkoz_01845 [Xenorhabdus kozodoii]
MTISAVIIGTMDRKPPFCHSLIGFKPFFAAFFLGERDVVIILVEAYLDIYQSNFNMRVISPREAGRYKTHLERRLV